MASRIEQLEQFLREDPGDPFNLFALGLEYQKIDQYKAIHFFTRLTSEHKEYVPTYYHLAKLYQELSENEKALKVFDEGIDQAEKQKDVKALRELQAAKHELLFDS